MVRNLLFCTYLLVIVDPYLFINDPNHLKLIRRQFNSTQAVRLDLCSVGIGHWPNVGKKCSLELSKTISFYLLWIHVKAVVL